jgi:hypothetical protein
LIFLLFTAFSQSLLIKILSEGVQFPAHLLNLHILKILLLISAISAQKLYAKLAFLLSCRFSPIAFSDFSLFSGGSTTPAPATAEIQRTGPQGTPAPPPHQQQTGAIFHSAPLMMSSTK